MSLTPDLSDKAMASRLFAILLNPSTLEVFAEVWKLTKKLWRGLANEGMYEVLEYEATYEIKDRQGKKAHFRKKERVRYLQDNIISYRDQAWGEGEILQNYRCSPGVKADEYQLGHKTFILISLREMKRRGDVDEFHVEWDMHNAFTQPSEYCETEISHRTKHLVIQVIFPASRKPNRVAIVENSTRKTQLLDSESERELSDGRWRIRWECPRPRLYERYILKWDW